nr:hypothetical protein [Tanacetum cinerariifolium]
MLTPQGEGSGTSTEPHHTPSPEAQQTSPTTHSSPTLPPITTALIPTFTPYDTPHLRQYTRRARIAQSSALLPVADEPPSPLIDVSQGKACPIVSSLDAEQDRANIAKTSTLPHESTLRVPSLAADEGKLSKSKMMSKSFEALQKHVINLEIDLQQCQEKIKNDKSFNENQSEEFCKEHEQYFKIQDLKAQLQDKGIVISESKKLIEKMKGKSVKTKFEKSSVIRQPNAFKSQRPSILGKPTIFSDSLERKDFSKSKSVETLAVGIKSLPMGTSATPLDKTVAASMEVRTLVISSVSLLPFSNASSPSSNLPPLLGHHLQIVLQPRLFYPPTA